MNTKTFAKRLREARERKGYSQKMLGVRVGLSDKSIVCMRKVLCTLLSPIFLK